MKKIWIGVVIIILFVIIDIGVRVLWNDKEDSSVTQVEINKQPKPPVYEQPDTSVEASKNKNKQDKEEIEEQAEPKPLVLRSKSPFKTCKEMVTYIFNKDINKLTRQDVQKAASYMDDSDSSKNTIEALDKYFSCKAVEMRSFEYCSRAEDIVRIEVDCRYGFMNIMPIIMKYMANQDLAKFQVTALEYPKEIKDYVIKFFKIMESGDSSACEGLGSEENEFGPLFCGIATGKFKSAEELDEAGSMYWGLTSIMKQDKSRLDNIKANETMKRIASAALGMSGQCEALLTGLVDEICE